MIHSHYLKTIFSLIKKRIKKNIGDKKSIRMNCKFINDARSVKVKNSTNDIAKLQIKNKLSEPEEFLYVKILLSL